MKKIMILGGSDLQLPAIKYANEIGLHVIVVDFNKDCVGFNYVDEKLLLSTLDYDGIKKYVMNNHIDGIMTLATDRPVNVVAKIAHDFGLKAISIESAVNSTNKVNMRRVLSKYNIKMPNFSVATNYSEFSSAINSIPGQIIVKPSDNAGKRGIRQLNDKNSLIEKKKVFSYALENSISKEVLVEELIIGREYSVETITYNNETSIIAVTKKYNTGKPSFVEIGHSQPADITYSQYLDIESLVKNAISILGINNTACHIEVMINNNGVFLIEIGPRLGGDNISTALVKLSTGVDMVKAMVQLCLGENPHFERKFNRGSAIRYILPSHGIYKGYLLKENIQKFEGFYDFVITKKEGYKMGSLTNSNDRLGYIIFSGTDREDAENKAIKALNLVSLKIEKNQG